MKITVVGRDVYLFQKIRLLRRGDEVVLSSTCDGAISDRIIFDLDTAACEVPQNVITVSASKEARLSLPFTEAELDEALSDDVKCARLTLSATSRCATLDGVEIKLTEVEFALLEVLYSAQGGYVCREELTEKVWHGEHGNGVINVYIHYLREKIERGAEKIILYSRREGYRLSELVLGKSKG